MWGEIQPGYHLRGFRDRDRLTGEPELEPLPEEIIEEPPCHICGEQPENCDCEK